MGRPKVYPRVKPLAGMGHDCEKAEITSPLLQAMPASLAALPTISGHLQKPHREHPMPKPLLRANVPGRKLPVIREMGKNLPLAKECFSWSQVLNFLIFPCVWIYSSAGEQGPSSAPLAAQPRRRRLGRASPGPAAGMDRGSRASTGDFGGLSCCCFSTRPCPCV